MCRYQRVLHSIVASAVDIRPLGDPFRDCCRFRAETPLSEAKGDSLEREFDSTRLVVRFGRATDETNSTNFLNRLEAIHMGVGCSDYGA